MTADGRQVFQGLGDGGGSRGEALEPRRLGQQGARLSHFLVAIQEESEKKRQKVSAHL